ncbi:DEAD/DEAH box helicase [Sporosarcina sp. ITBMC105]
MQLSNLLSRADEFTIQQMMGTQTVRILRLLNEETIYNSHFKKLILRLHSSQVLLLTKVYRDDLIDLMKEPEIKALARILGLYSPHEPISRIYNKVKNEKFRLGSKKQQSLFEFFNIKLSKQENEKVEVLNKVIGSYSLFPHQRVAAKKTSDLLLRHPNRVLLHMPTGSGKTRTSMNVICDYLRRNEPTVVIWFATTEELCIQAIEEFSKAWRNLGNREINTYKFWGDAELDLNDVKDGFIVAGLPKMVSRFKAQGGKEFISQLAHKTTFIIMDEAHQAVAPTYEFLLDTLMSIGKQKSLLGLSATPGRTYDNKEEDLRLANFFSRTKVKLEVEGYTNPVDYLTEAGYLSKVVYYPLIYNNTDLTEAERQSIMTSKDISSSILNKLAEDEKRNLLIVNEAIRLSRNHKRIILFAPSVKSSNMISFILESQGLHSRSLTGLTDKSLRQEMIDDFKNDDDKPKVLCNYGVLTTGFDAPSTSAAIIGRPTLSLVLYSQMVGRAIRGINAGGNEEAEIVTIVDQELPGFRSVSEAFENWEDVW